MQNTRERGQQEWEGVGGVGGDRVDIKSHILHNHAQMGTPARHTQRQEEVGEDLPALGM